VAMIWAKRVIALAVSSAARLGAFPDVPTVAESGVQGANVTPVFGILAPAGTPRAIVERLNAEALKALASPEVKEKLAVLGADPMPMSTSDFDAFLRSETARIAEIVKSAGIKAQ